MAGTTRAVECERCLTPNDVVVTAKSFRCANCGKWNRVKRRHIGRWVGVLVGIVTFLAAGLTVLNAFKEGIDGSRTTRPEVERFFEEVSSVARRDWVPPWEKALQPRVDFNVTVWRIKGLDAEVQRDEKADHPYGTREKPWISFRTNECPDSGGQEGTVTLFFSNYPAGAGTQTVGIAENGDAVRITGVWEIGHMQHRDITAGEDPFCWVDLSPNG